jgi:hypothetical protein
MLPGGRDTIRDVRFGVIDGTRFSQYWKVAATTNRPELVISGNRTGSFLHLTMHESDAFWHIKVTPPNGAQERPWRPPSELLPGVRRLVRLVIPGEAVRHAAPRRHGRVAWYPASTDPDMWTQFTVLHCVRGRPEIPSANVIGSARIADGSEAVVIAQLVRGSTEFFRFTAEDADATRALFQRPTTAALIHGEDTADGCLWVLELHAGLRASEPPASP